ncbi:hypothetical protein LF1_35030 [Rubripirellula obstinata]|uniref:Uncharacterized protein n=1 Tax=Rubripirellula obstinata TaxID=406547 RepID=A0A5B1CKX2_9BACT|nr:hypothetical protein LF1_35030 [Rubripirellula obstinata]
MPKRLNELIRVFFTALSCTRLNSTEPWRAQLPKISPSTELVSGQFLSDHKFVKAKTLQVKIVQGIDQMIEIVLGFCLQIGLSFRQLIINANGFSSRE